MKQRSLKFDRTAPAELLIEVAGRFEEASWTLARLPGINMRAIIPKEIEDDFEDETLTHASRKPTSVEISRMDETFTWIGFLPPMPEPRRVVVLKRLVRNARTGKFRYSWRRLGKALGVSHHTAIAWHAEAMELIARKITQTQIFASHTAHLGLSETLR